MNSHEYFMNLAYEEAIKGYLEDEVPIGAVLVYKGKVVARGYNQKEKSNNILDHAEIIVIKKAAEQVGSWKLDGFILYVTLEPCLMCYSAIKQSRIKKVYAGLRGYREKEYTYTKYLLEDELIDYSIKSIKSKELLTKFFENKRR